MRKKEKEIFLRKSNEKRMLDLGEEKLILVGHKKVKRKEKNWEKRKVKRGKEMKR